MAKLETAPGVYYAKGYKARSEGKYITTCPYTQLTQIQNWQLGWIAAHKDQPKIKLFSLGQVVATPGALIALDLAVPSDAGKLAAWLLQRHQTGDWGDLDPEDKALNDEAVKTGEDRVFSAYILSDGTKVWIITEWDRSATTLLLPEEY